MENLSTLKNFKFKIGKTYYHRTKGPYIVVKIDKGTIRVRFEDGSENDLGENIAKRMHQNIVIDNQPIAIHNRAIQEEHDRINNNYSIENFAWTLGALASVGNLFVEVGGKFAKKFNDMYKKKDEKILGNRTGHQTHELRLIFPGWLLYKIHFCLPNGVHIEASTLEKGAKRINNNDFLWRLVNRYNFSFSNNQNIYDIMERLTEIERESFIKGYETCEEIKKNN